MGNRTGRGGGERETEVCTTILETKHQRIPSQMGVSGSPCSHVTGLGDCTNNSGAFAAVCTTGFAVRQTLGAYLITEGEGRELVTARNEVVLHGIVQQFTFAIGGSTL